MDNRAGGSGSSDSGGETRSILQQESEDFFDNNAVSLSSAVVSDAEVETEFTFSNDLLIIAPPGGSNAGSKSGSTTSLVNDPRLTVPTPPLLNTKKKSKLKTSNTNLTERRRQRKSKGGFDAESSTGSGTGSDYGGRGDGGGYDDNMPRISIYSEDESDSLFKNGVKGVRKEEKLTYFGFTKKQWLTLIVFGMVNVFATTVVSLQAPFYPKEAELKGATATEYGLVFGVFQLTMFVMSPIFGSVMGSKINPRLMFNLGIFVAGSCAILFGFLDYIQDHLTFIALSFALRIIQACGDAAFVTASFTIIALEFPDSVATTFAALETCSGVGLILGPTIGGALYEVGGFLLPFVSMGGLLFFAAIVTYFVLPEVTYTEEIREKENAPSGSGFGFISLIKLPPVAIAAFSIVVSSSSIGFLNATLEPHLRANFGLTPFYTGLLFIIDGGVYALSAPVWGRLCDSSSQPKYITLVGCFLTFTGFLLIGPAPFIPLPTILWLTITGLVIHGLGVGASLVSGFIQGLIDAVNNGFPDSVSTYGLLSGMWTSAFALGSFVGPSIGGVLLDNVGFRLSTIYVLGSQVLVAFLVILYICCAKSSDPDDPENDPLLRNEDISFNSFNETLKRQQSVPGSSNSRSSKFNYGAV